MHKYKLKSNYLGTCTKGKDLVVTVNQTLNTSLRSDAIAKTVKIIWEYIHKSILC